MSIEAIEKGGRRLKELEINPEEEGILVVQAVAPFLEVTLPPTIRLQTPCARLKTYLRRLKTQYPPVIKTDFFDNMQRFSQDPKVATAWGTILHRPNPTQELFLAIMYGLYEREPGSKFVEEFREFLLNPGNFVRTARRTGTINGQPIGTFFEKVIHWFFESKPVPDTLGTTPSSRAFVRIITDAVFMACEQPFLPQNKRQVVNVGFIEETAAAYGYSLPEPVIQETIIGNLSKVTLLFDPSPEELRLSEVALSLISPKDGH